MRDYPLIPCAVYALSSSAGWWLSIVFMAAIREKLTYSHPPVGLNGTALAFIMAGIMSMGFMGFSGINLSRPTGGVAQHVTLASIDKEMDTHSMPLGRQEPKNYVSN
jgi:Na+-transporting NADH:ubiquinone oxidoreductase subunit E